MHIVRNISKSGYRIASISSSSSDSASTGNWTFTHRVIEALSGESVADIDGDGIITIGDIAKYVQKSMRYFERQKSGYSQYGLGNDFIIRRLNNGDKIDKISVGDYVYVKKNNRRSVACVIAKDIENKKLDVRFQEYSETPHEWVNMDSLKLITNPPKIIK